MFEKIIAGETAIIHPEIKRSVYKCGQRYYGAQDNGRNSVMFITEGEGRFTADKQTVSFSAGDVLFLPDGCECEYIFEQKGAPCADIISFKLIGRESVSNGEFLHIDSEKRNTVRIMRMTADQMIEKNENNVVGKELLLISCLYKLVYELYSAKNESPIERKEIQKAVKYIESNYLDEFEIEEVARKCGMCLSLFYKSFKECTGFTPIGYKNRLKIERAVELLEEKHYSLDDISKMLNFCNQSYFIRLFKHFTGCTPKQFMARR